MSLQSSIHTHNHFCDGQGSIAEVVAAARAAGLERVGISSHAPLPFATGWAMPLERLPDYLGEVRALQTAGDIDVALGLEIDYIPDVQVQRFQESEILGHDVDYRIGSIHFLGRSTRSFDGSREPFVAILREDYAGDIRAMVEDYYQRTAAMARLPHVNLIGHMDRIKRWNDDNAFFHDDEPWYRDAVEGALGEIAAAGKPIELNTSGWRKGSAEAYPAPWILELCRDRGNGVVITADTHAPDQVTWGFDRAEALLAGLGMRAENSAQPADASAVSPAVRETSVPGAGTGSDRSQS